MAVATGDAVLRAYSKAAKKLDKDPSIIASEVFAGFILPEGQKRGEKEGYQVSVKMYRYSEKLLKEDKESGGLLVYAKNGGK